MKKTKFLFSRGILYFIILLTILYGCSKKADDEIKIGAILGLTGKLSVVGEGEKKGLLLALDSLKTKFSDKSIELIIEDFGSETKNAITAVNKLIDIDKVDAIIAQSTAVAEAISPIIDSKKIITFVISPDVEILDKSIYNFRIYYNFEAETKKLNQFLKSSAIRDISILSTKYSSYQKVIDKRIKPFSEKNDISIKSIDYFDVAEKDFKTLITKVKKLSPNLLYIIPLPQQINLLRNQIMENDYKINDDSKIVGSFIYNWMPFDFIQTLENYYILSPKYQIEDNTNIFAQQFYSRFKIYPSFDMVYAYDNLSILTNLLIKSNKDYDKFVNLFNSLGSYIGASGRIDFIGNRDTNVEVVLTQIVNGKQVLIN